MESHRALGHDPMTFSPGFDPSFEDSIEDDLDEILEDYEDHGHISAEDLARYRRLKRVLATIDNVEPH